MAYTSQEESENVLDFPDQYAEHFDTHLSKRNSSLGRLDKVAGKTMPQLSSWDFQGGSCKKQFSRSSLEIQSLSSLLAAGLKKLRRQPSNTDIARKERLVIYLLLQLCACMCVLIDLPKGLITSAHAEEQRQTHH